MGRGNCHDDEGLDAGGNSLRLPWQDFIRRRAERWRLPGALSRVMGVLPAVSHRGLGKLSRDWLGQLEAPRRGWLGFCRALLARHLPLLSGQASRLPMPGLPSQPIEPNHKSIRKGEAGAMESATTTLAPGVQEIQAVIEHSAYRLPERRMLNSLARVLRLSAPAVKIYTGHAADFAARRMGADAVSYGDVVLFRDGQYDPYGRRGRGLLGHELTHAALAHTAPEVENPQAEERLAVENERAIRSSWSFTPVEMAFPPPPAWRQTAAAPVEPVPMPARAPRAAVVDRDVETRPAQPRASPPLQLTERQLAMIKEAVYRDIKDRIRIDFERGG